MKEDDKYRIITNGEVFRVSIKWLFGLRYLAKSQRGPFGDFCVIDFATKKEAEDYVLWLKGEHPRCKWRLA